MNTVPPPLAPNFFRRSHQKLPILKIHFLFPFFFFVVVFFFYYRGAAATPGKTITEVVEDRGVQNLMGKSKNCAQ